jgi:hypothetical protein
MLRNFFKRSKLKIESVTEKECYKNLTTLQLYEISRGFQHQRRTYLGMFLECLEQKHFVLDDPSEVEKTEEERKVLWEYFLHYNELVCWIELEIDKRQN